MPKKQKASKIDYEAMADFRYAIRRFLNFSEQAARLAGLEAQQYQALLALKGMPQAQRATVGGLATRLQIRHHSAVELTLRLEANGLVRRSRNRGDRREVLLQLSPRGEKVLRQLALTHRAELHSAAPTLLRALKAIVGHSGNGRPHLVEPGTPKAVRGRLPESARGGNGKNRRPRLTS